MQRAHRGPRVRQRVRCERRDHALRRVEQGDEGAPEQDERWRIPLDENGEQPHRPEGDVAVAVAVQVVATVRVPVVALEHGIGALPVGGDVEGVAGEIIRGDAAGLGIGIELDRPAVVGEGIVLDDEPRGAMREQVG